MSPLASPLLFPTGHENLPRTYLQICGMDPLRDDSIIYERVLQECGVETRVSMYPGLPHGFWTFFPNANFTNEFLKETLAGFAWLLQKRE
jgi:acetyl esterase/lipase